MPETSFDARLRRITEARTGAAPTGAGPGATPAAAPIRPTGGGKVFLICMFFLPLGIAMRIARELYMDLTPEAVYFVQVLVFVVVTHLLLIGVTALAGIAHRSRGPLFWIALITWAGYGVGSALMALKDFG